nr:hypothetical protein BaRGS_002952 [Batillaria attramentaria]
MVSQLVVVTPHDWQVLTWEGTPSTHSTVMQMVNRRDETTGSLLDVLTWLTVILVVHSSVAMLAHRGVESYQLQQTLMKQGKTLERNQPCVTGCLLEKVKLLDL